jgi:hypothetical protein
VRKSQDRKGKENLVREDEPECILNAGGTLDGEPAANQKKSTKDETTHIAGDVHRLLYSSVSGRNGDDIMVGMSPNFMVCLNELCIDELREQNALQRAKMEELLLMKELKGMGVPVGQLEQ